ncbi:urea transporter [Legionella sp. km535]|nr:urea transporter [Legionella sp. km535]
MDIVMLSTRLSTILNFNSVYSFKTNVVHRLFRAYATVFFCYSPWVGAWFALISWASPRTAFAGLFSLLCTSIFGRLLSINPPGDLHLVNGLLCGLFLSAYYPISIQLFLGLIIITLFITTCTNWLCNFMWNLGKVPLMTLPFVLGTWPLIILFHEQQLVSFPSLMFVQANLPSFMSFPWSDVFFSTVGGLMLVPYPLPGALIFLGLFVASRYLTFLVISGYIIGALTLHLFGYDMLITQTGYNFMLATIAIGGIFMVPGKFSYFVALCGSALAALSVVVLYKLLFPVQLPLLVLPFLLSTYFWLGGLNYRIKKKKGPLNLDMPVSPEIAWERYRLESVRGIHLESIFITQFFAEEWRVALDSKENHFYFARIDEVDEHPVYAPVNASVVEMRDSANVKHHKAAIDQSWGNFILLRDYGGQYILLPYLKKGSLKPNTGDWITAGLPIAACEQFDKEHRFYIQVQKGVRPSSEMVPYHFSNVITHKPNQPKQFNLFYYPTDGDYIVSAQRNNELAEALDLQSGLTLHYRVTCDNEPECIMMLQTGITPQGQTRLYAQRDRSLGYEQTPLTLAFYDSQGEKDILLDLWALALGLTPLTTQAEVWSDSPALDLWPLDFGKRLLLRLIRPLGVGCRSVYTRSWNEESKVWIQKATHKADILPGMQWHAATTAFIDPEKGVIKLSLEVFGKTWEAELIQGQHSGKAGA